MPTKKSSSRKDRAEKRSTIKRKQHRQPEGTTPVKKSISQRSLKSN